MIPEQRILWGMARHAAAWRQVLEQYHPEQPAQQKAAIMTAYFEGDLVPEETGALISAMGLRGA
jgi:hypothetical protein